MRENAGDQVGIGVNFASDWLMEWHKFSGPITEQSKAKPKKSWVTFDTQLKITLMILNAILVDIFFHRVQLRLFIFWFIKFNVSFIFNFAKPPFL